MKKFCLFIFLGTLVLGTAMKALADSRLDGMSADARAVEDMDLIWLYPNKALQYKNTVDIRLTNSDSGYYSTWNGDYNEWGGILKDAGDIGVLGVYSGRPQIENWDAGYSDTYMYQTFGPNQLGYWFQYTANEWTDWSHDGYSMLYSAWTPVGGVDWFNFAGIDDPHNKLDAFWAKGFSDLDLGVRLSYGDNQEVMTNDSYDARTLALSVGVGMTSLAPFSEANFHVGYAMGTVDTGSGGVKDNGIATYSLGALLVSELGGDNSLRLYGDVNLDQFALQGNSSYINNDLVTLLGAALSHKLGKGFVNSSLSFVYGGQMYKTDTTNPEDNIAWWDVIWNVAFETPLSGWLTYRAGLSKPVFERYYEKVGGAAAAYGDNSGNSWSSLNMGLTANIENLTIDALLNVGAIENFLGNPNLNQLTYDNSALFDTNSGPGPLSLVEVDLKAKI